MLARQEAVAPEACVQTLLRLVLRDEHDERGQILVCAAQAIGEPGAHARSTGQLRAGLQKRDRRVVVDRFGEARLHEAKIVGHLGGVRQQLTECRRRLAVLVELEDRPRQRQNRLVARHAGEALPLANALRQILAVLFVEQRLVIEQVKLRRSAGHEQVNNPLRLRRKMRFVENACEGIAACGFASKQRRNRDPAQAQRGGAEEQTAIGRREDGVVHIAAHSSPHTPCADLNNGSKKRILQTLSSKSAHGVCGLLCGTIVVRTLRVRTSLRNRNARRFGRWPQVRTRSVRTTIVVDLALGQIRSEHTPPLSNSPFLDSPRCTCGVPRIVLDCEPNDRSSPPAKTAHSFQVAC